MLAPDKIYQRCYSVGGKRHSRKTHDNIAGFGEPCTPEPGLEVQLRGMVKSSGQPLGSNPQAPGRLPDFRQTNSFTSLPPLPRLKNGAVLRAK